MTHGPLKEKNYKRKISKKMRAQALFSVLSKKMKDGEILFVDTLSVPEIKTSKAVEVVNNLVTEIDRVAYENRNSHEYSVKQMADFANNFLTNIIGIEK